jgi:hypothetical protein
MPKNMAGVMKEYKQGKLHSGSKKGPKVKSRKQAIAIGLSEQRKLKGKPAVAASSGIVPQNKPTFPFEAKTKKVPYSQLGAALAGVTGSGPFSQSDINRGYKVEYTASDLAKLNDDLPEVPAKIKRSRSS